MFSFRIDQAKSRFFDVPRVINAMDAATYRALSKAGAFVRRTAKGLIRKVGKKGTPSSPGSPPKSRTGILKDYIFFAWDPGRRSVIIGPAKTNQVFFQGAGQPATGTVPAVLEYGGQIGILEWFLPTRQKWVRADLRSKRKIAERQTRIRTVNIEARPYMGPALEKEAPNFPSLWSMRAAA